MTTATIRDLVGAARSRLVRAGLPPEQAGSDAEVLARDALGWDRATYLADGRVVAPRGFRRRYAQVVERRERREPVSLITGRREFWGLEFEVTPDVLTPRPETELLVAEAVSCLRAPEARGRRVVDVGTGSGCVAVSIAHEMPDCHVIGIDLSFDALKVARRNANRHGVAGRMAWVCAPLLEARVHAADLDLIVANLPYIPDSEVATLPPEVREYEPHQALLGGADGLDAIRALIGQADRCLGPGGWLVLECGVGQSDSLRQHVSSIDGLEVTAVHHDLQAIPRVLTVRKH